MVNATLTVFLLTPAVPYSSEVQQPMHATAVLSSHPHTRHAAWFDREQVSVKGVVTTAALRSKGRGWLLGLVLIWQRLGW